MKIAYIVSVFPSLSETFILNEILELKRRGFDINVFSIGKPKDSVCHPEAASLMQSVHYLEEEFGIGKNLKRVFLYAYFLLVSPIGFIRALDFAVRYRSKGLRKGAFWARRFRLMGIEHIHAHFADLPTEVALPVSLLSGLPYTFTVHARDLFSGPKAMATKLRNARAVITHCAYNKRYLLENWPVIPAESIAEIHCSIEPGQFSRSREYMNTGMNMLAVGRLVEKKGLHYLIEACAKLKERGLTFTCSIVGSGPEEGALKNMVEEKGLAGSVFLLGPKSRVEIKELLEKTTVFVLPCIEAADGDRDSLPTVIKEAMAMEVPVITTMNESIGELVRDGAGVLVAPRDVDGLAEAIVSLSAMDENDLKRMGKEGRAIIERSFTIQSQSDKLIHFFEGSTMKSVSHMDISDQTM